MLYNIYNKGLCLYREGKSGFYLTWIFAQVMPNFTQENLH